MSIYLVSYRVSIWFRAIPESVSEPFRVIPNQSEKPFLSRLMENGQKSIRLNPIRSNWCLRLSQIDFLSLFIKRDTTRFAEWLGIALIRSEWISIRYFRQGSLFHKRYRGNDVYLSIWIFNTLSISSKVINDTCWLSVSTRGMASSKFNIRTTESLGQRSEVYTSGTFSLQYSTLVKRHKR